MCVCVEEEVGGSGRSTGGGGVEGVGLNLMWCSRAQWQNGHLFELRLLLDVKQGSSSHRARHHSARPASSDSPARLDQERREKGTHGGTATAGGLLPRSRARVANDLIFFGGNTVVVFFPSSSISFFFFLFLFFLILHCSPALLLCLPPALYLSTRQDWGLVEDNVSCARIGPRRPQVTGTSSAQQFVTLMVFPMAHCSYLCLCRWGCGLWCIWFSPGRHKEFNASVNIILLSGAYTDEQKVGCSCKRSCFFGLAALKSITEGTIDDYTTWQILPTIHNLT